MSNVRMTWDGKVISEKVHQAGVKALRDGSEHLLTTANYTIPHETGEMMRGGVADIDEDTKEATVSYGHNSSAPYTVKQHEDTTLRHDEGRRAKWLEMTLNEEREKIHKHIESQLRKQLGG